MDVESQQKAGVAPLELSKSEEPSVSEKTEKALTEITAETRSFGHKHKKKILIGIFVIFIISISLTLGLILGRDTDILSDVVPDKHYATIGKIGPITAVPINPEPKCEDKRCCKPIKGIQTRACYNLNIKECVYTRECTWDCNVNEIEDGNIFRDGRTRVFDSFVPDIGRFDDRYDNEKYEIPPETKFDDGNINDDREWNARNMQIENSFYEYDIECRARFKVTLTDDAITKKLIDFFQQNPTFGSQNGECKDKTCVNTDSPRDRYGAGECDRSGSKCEDGNDGDAPPKPQRRLTIFHPDGRSRVWSKSYPWRTSGYLSFVDNSGQSKYCSATLIARRHVLTAAHCVHGGKGGSLFTQFRFYPGAVSSSDITASNRYYISGAWVFTKFVTTSWPSAISDDIGILRLSVSNTYKGWLGFTSGGGLFTNFNTVGYPGDKGAIWPYSKWYQYCLYFRFSSKRYYSAVCDVWGGQSGSPNYHYWSSSGQRKIRAITSAHGNWYARLTSGKTGAICGLIAGGESPTCY